MSSRFNIFLGFKIHNWSGLTISKKSVIICEVWNLVKRFFSHLIQFQRTQGNHKATPSSTTRNKTSKTLRLSSGTFFFQNSPRISESRKQTVMRSIIACETRPNRDWCSWAVSMDCLNGTGFRPWITFKFKKTKTNTTNKTHCLDNRHTIRKSITSFKAQGEEQIKNSKDKRQTKNNGLPLLSSDAQWLPFLLNLYR